MKQSREVVEKRRSQILSLVNQHHNMRVDMLAEYFQTSTMTIRRDLKYLSERRQLNRTFGGAVVADLSTTQSVKEAFRESFRRMGRMGAAMIQDGDTIFINGSSTALAVLDHVEDKHVHVITNNVNIIGRKYPPNVVISLTGGELQDHILAGIDVIRYLSNIEADKTFMGCARVYSSGKFAYSIPTEIAINEVMVDCTKGDLIMMADHTKLFPHSYDLDEQQYGSFSLKRQCTLITDELADYEIISRLRECGIQVHQAKPEPKPHQAMPAGARSDISESPGLV